MKVFLTGASGFIGSHVAVALVRAGHEVTALSRSPLPYSLEGVTPVVGDLQDPASYIEDLQGHAAVLHCALLWDEEPTEFVLKDPRASVALFRAASQTRIGQILYTSSMAVHRPFSGVITPDSPLWPDGYYGACKACAEAFLFAFSHQTSMRCNIIRPGLVVGGPAVAGAKVNPVRQMVEWVQNARDSECILVPGGGRQFIGAADLARLYVAILESDKNRAIYLAESTECVPWTEVATEIVIAANSQSPISVIGEEEPFRTDVSAMRDDFGLSFTARSAVKEHIQALLG